MLDYRAPVAEMLFTLRHVAGADRLDGWDDELFAEVIAQAGRFIDAEVAPLDPIADAADATVIDGRVQLPPEFATVYRNLVAGGWPTLSAPEEHGGQGLPKLLSCAVSEMLSGACVTFQMIITLAQGALRTLGAHAGDALQQRYMPALASGEWLATMCLSEPTAGSDLGQIRTTASAAGDGSWRLTGTKIFISGGDHALTDNIVHLVLARTDGAPAGVRGLALFVCAAVLPDGTRNGIEVLRVEEKMGMHSSPTCQLAFDGAQADIIGAPGEGLARMFTMMNAERLDVATQGIGLADVAAQRAWAYALERRQGRAPGSGNALDSIARHGDVQRMLLEQRALVLGIRALVYRTMTELELGTCPALVEFLTPVCKAFCSEAAVRAADLGIQVHGGYGYCREYRAEQVFRDARITMIYEGTNGIQAMTLAGRLLQLDDGACAQAFRDDVGAAREQARTAGHEATAAALDAALADWEKAAAAVTGRDPGLDATPFMRLTGLVAFGAAWARIECAADAAPNPSEMKLLARFVCTRMLPETGWLAQLVAGNNGLREDADALFAAD